MTAEDQVKEIIILMNPEEPETQYDAVFLVKRFMDVMREKLSTKDKQIALLEAKLEEAQRVRMEAQNECIKATDEAHKARAEVAGAEERVREKIWRENKGLKR